VLSNVASVRAAFTLLLSATLTLTSVAAEKDHVVVYTSVDEILSAEIFNRIEEQTGLDIRPVYDSEATKTTGLYLRLIEEKNRPRADVFWNSEFSRTLLLKKEGVLARHDSEAVRSIPEKYRDSEGYWTGLSLRARVLAYNSDLLSASDVPRSATELLDPKWKGKIAWANPMFGTTGTHCGALLAVLGEGVFTNLVGSWADQFHELPSNGQVANFVARGTFPLGITDTDDVWRLRASGRPIDHVPFDFDGRGTLLIPNTVALIKGAPNEGPGRRFIDALFDPQVERFLAFSTSRQLPVRPDVEIPDELEPWRSVPSLDVRYEDVAENVDQALKITRKILLK